MTSIEGIMDNNRETADNIGEQDTNQQLILKRNVEKIFIESGPLVIESRDVTGDVLIWSNATHGIWDTDKWDNDVTDLDAYSIVRVTNPNNIWREHFRNTQFKDTTYTTATWDTTNFIISFIPGQIVQTLDIFKNSQTITRAKVMATESSGSDIDYFLSIDGGLTWVQVENNVETDLNPNQIRIKIDTARYPAGRQDIVLSAAGAPSGSAYESYNNSNLIGATVSHPYILGGIVYDTDGSTPLGDVYLRAYNETTRTYSCTVKPTHSTKGKFLLDSRSFGIWAHGDYVRFTIVGGTGTGGQLLRFKAVARSTSTITNLKVQYWT